MTIRQEAHGLIDRMPEDSIRILLPVMTKLVPFKAQKPALQTADISPKMRAFLDMQEMRKASVQYDFSEAQRKIAMAEKYGDIEWRKDE